MLSRQLRNAVVAVVALTVLQFVPLKAAVAPALRTAIVIGNGTYPRDQLKNPTNDARAMANALRELGFDVKLAEDLSLEQFRALVRDPTAFAQGSVAVFYYAGHAVQFKGINYLLPVDFELKKPEDLPSVSVDLTEVMNDMNGAGVGFSIIILDSCRNYPFGEMAEAFGSGLATVAASGETLVAYSTAAGGVALDGNGPNSPYTSALVSALELPGRDIYEVFRTVRAKVREATNGRQLPWITGSVESELVFREPEPQIASDAGKTDLASVLWRSIEKSRDPTDFAKFLALYSTDNELAPKATARRGELVGAGESELPPVAVETESIPGPSGAEVAVTACDRWASDPLDPQRIAPGVPWNTINTRQAIRDCIADLTKDPDNPRLNFNLARALDLAERFSEAETYYNRAADQSYGAAFRNLGYMYRNGRGVARDDVRAADYYLKASLRGVPAGRDGLGMMYEQGWGVPQSAVDSIHWLTLAAEDNFAPAVDHLGNVYRLGKGVTVDLAKARELYERAAFGGNSNAMANLARIYREGLGVPVDVREAVRWYDRATELGNPFAPYQLSQMYLKGEKPVRRDAARALKLLQLSADRGYEWAFWRLARFYEAGEDGKKDLETAAYYFHIARAAAEAVHNPSGDQLAADAARKLEDFARTVDPAVLARAEARSQAWLTQNGVSQVGLFYQY
jgi:TPR repeat protein